MKKPPIFFSLLLLSLPAAAAGPAEGIAAAREGAELRTEGPELVEIEGFTGVDGDIPCSRSSYSNSWHYKFHSADGWFLVNACGQNFINSSKHITYGKAAEPEKPLPASFADPAEVLKKMAEDGVFLPEPNPYDRDVLMNIRRLPAAEGRPEGCYWTVSRGKVKALADCAAERTWKLSGARPAAKAVAGGPAVKGRDTAGRYAQQAIDTIRAKRPGAQLMYIETLADRTGSAKCVIPEDGWSYVFFYKGGKSGFGACMGKTSAEYVSFDGSAGGEFDRLDPITLPFKDSDFALTRVPAGFVKNCSTISMRLQNFKPAFAPSAGHSLVWTLDCGSQRHLVDAQTGGYIGPAKKTPPRVIKNEKRDLGLMKPE